MTEPLANCPQCGELAPEGTDSPFCSLGCVEAHGVASVRAGVEAALLSTERAIANAPPARRIRPRLVRLQVVQDGGGMSREAVARELARRPMPATRADCANIPRPCPHVRCKYNLYLDVLDDGVIRYNFPGLEPGEMKESCVLDLAERDGMTLEEIGHAINLTRERVRQLVEQAKKNGRRRTNPIFRTSIDVEDFTTDRQTHHALEGED